MKMNIFFGKKSHVLCVEEVKYQYHKEIAWLAPVPLSDFFSSILKPPIFSPIGPKFMSYMAQACRPRKAFLSKS